MDDRPIGSVGGVGMKLSAEGLCVSQSDGVLLQPPLLEKQLRDEDAKDDHTC